VSGGEKISLLLCKNAGGIQCVFFFLGRKLFQGKRKHEKFIVWVFLRPFFKNKIITTMAYIDVSGSGDGRRRVREES
jgi:hypothetical protein